MFSHLSVSHSVHGGCAWQGCVHGGDACMVWGEVCVVGDVHGGDVCMAGGMRGGRDSHCSGWYASYWNAFLFQFCIRLC